MNNTNKSLHYLSPSKYSKIHHRFKSKSKHYKTPVINQQKSKYNSKRKFFKKQGTETVPNISQSHDKNTIEGDG